MLDAKPLFANLQELVDKNFVEKREPSKGSHRLLRTKSGLLHLHHIMNSTNVKFKHSNDRSILEDTRQGPNRCTEA